MITTRKVKGTYLKPDGSAKRGYIEFTPNSALVQFDDSIIYPSTFRADLDDNGYFEIDLAVTDDTNWNPVGWLWIVEEKIEGGVTWYLEVPTDAADLDISTVYMVGLAPPSFPVWTAPVVSVNGQDGIVVLGPDDIGAEHAGSMVSHVTDSDPHAQYLLQAADDTVLGKRLNFQFAAAQPIGDIGSFFDADVHLALKAIQELWLSGSTVVLDPSGNSVNIHKALNLLSGWVGTEYANLNGTAHRFGNLRLTNVADPVNPQDVVTKKYSDDKQKTPWAILSRTQALAAGWNQLIGWAGQQYGGFSYGGSNIFVPKPGVYRVTMRLTNTAVGRLIASIAVDGSGGHGSSSWFLGDLTTTATTEIVTGTRLVYINSYINPYANAATGTVTAYFSLEYVGSENAA